MFTAIFDGYNTAAKAIQQKQFIMIELETIKETFKNHTPIGESWAHHYAVILPLVDLDADFLFAELDSLGVTAILMTLSTKYGIELEAADATPKNLRNLDSIVDLVKRKQQEK